LRASNFADSYGSIRAMTPVRVQFSASSVQCCCDNTAETQRICLRHRNPSGCRAVPTRGNIVAWKLPNFLKRRFAAYKEESTMKKLTALTAVCVLMTGLAFAGQNNEADQKWLEVVQKKVAEGQTKISTPIEERVTLLKDWADKNGYSVAVSKNENSYRLDLSKNVAQK
jgi:hypothetical protein